MLAAVQDLRKYHTHRADKSDPADAAVACRPTHRTRSSPPHACATRAATCLASACSLAGQACGSCPSSCPSLLTRSCTQRQLETGQPLARIPILSHAWHLHILWQAKLALHVCHLALHCRHGPAHEATVDTVSNSVADCPSHPTAHYDSSCTQRNSLSSPS